MVLGWKFTNIVHYRTVFDCKGWRLQGIFSRILNQDSISNYFENGFFFVKVSALKTEDKKTQKHKIICMKIFFTL